MRMRRFVFILGLIAGALAAIDHPTARSAEELDPCPPQPAEFVQCFATMIPAPKDGLTPAELKQAYGFPTGALAGKGKTIAVISAFDAPTIENDLNVFSAEFGLPACTTANGCFEKVYARGTVPPVDAGWSLESTLDVEWIHAVAPGAKIVLVEASSNSVVDMLHAYRTAGLRGIKYISNSWGQYELEGRDLTFFEPLFTEFADDSSFFASGDIGGEVAFPSASPSVVSVGGTRLMTNTNGYKYSEIGWADGGGGCSAYYDAGAVQAAFAQYPSRCAGKRATPDIAAVGDPVNGGWIYLSTPFGSRVGWFVVGGTSFAAPVMAARAAITGKVWTPEYIYSAERKFFDVIYGNNGFKTKPGYDLVTGRGRFRA